MKIYRLIVPSLAGLLFALSTLVAFARTTPQPASPPPAKTSETNLLPGGFAEQIHADASGKLWITEVASDTIREFDPATNVFTLYTGLTSTWEAQVGPDGYLWWIDQSALGRMNLSTRLVTMYPLSDTFANALAFDSLNRVWVADFISIGLYRLNPSTNQLCDVDLPNNGASQTLVAHAGALWLGDVPNQRLGTINPATNDFTYWSLTALVSPTFAEPRSFTFAPNGDVWWADRGAGKLGRLEVGANRVRYYGPSSASTPRQVAYQGGRVWFTDPITNSFGFVDPSVAVGEPSVVVTPVTATLAPACATLTPGGSFTAGISTGVAAFSALATSTNADPEGTLYHVAGGEPWGMAATSFDVWTTDTARDKLIRVDNALRLYLPSIRR